MVPTYHWFILLIYSISMSNNNPIGMNIQDATLIVTIMTRIKVTLTVVTNTFWMLLLTHLTFVVQPTLHSPRLATSLSLRLPTNFQRERRMLRHISTRPGRLWHMYHSWWSYYDPVDRGGAGGVYKKKRYNNIQKYKI